MNTNILENKIEEILANAPKEANNALKDARIFPENSKQDGAYLRKVERSARTKTEKTLLTLRAPNTGEEDPEQLLRELSYALKILYAARAALNHIRFS